mmetsp:Transcript_91623/g.144856  ORF Transcript_91623/g.144856 Transcript_91623/m.144856 type:complete len:208 (+) Transcript_91623:558-1181(+)
MLFLTLRFSFFALPSVLSSWFVFLRGVTPGLLLLLLLGLAVSIEERFSRICLANPGFTAVTICVKTASSTASFKFGVPREEVKVSKVRERPGDEMRQQITEPWFRSFVVLKPFSQAVTHQSFAGPFFTTFDLHMLAATSGFADIFSGSELFTTRAHASLESLPLLLPASLFFALAFGFAFALATFFALAAAALKLRRKRPVSGFFSL